jgi:hypothetical protein
MVEFRDFGHLGLALEGLVLRFITKLQLGEKLEVRDMQKGREVERFHGFKVKNLVQAASPRQDIKPGRRWVGRAVEGPVRDHHEKVFDVRASTDYGFHVFCAQPYRHHIAHRVGDSGLTPAIKVNVSRSHTGKSSRKSSSR